MSLSAMATLRRLHAVEVHLSSIKQHTQIRGRRAVMLQPTHVSFGVPQLYRLPTLLNQALGKK